MIMKKFYISFLTFILITSVSYSQTKFSLLDNRNVENKFFTKHDLITSRLKFEKTALNSRVVLESKTPPLKWDKIFKEFAFGTCFSIGAAVVFGGLMYVAASDTHGYSNITEQDKKNTGAVGFVIGHAIGSPLGVIFGGSTGTSDRGSIVLAILGDALAETGSLALHVSKKNAGTFILYLLASPILSTFGYNLIRSWK